MRVWATTPGKNLSLLKFCLIYRSLESIAEEGEDEYHLKEWGLKLNSVIDSHGQCEKGPTGASELKSLLFSSYQIIQSGLSLLLS